MSSDLSDAPDSNGPGNRHRVDEGGGGARDPRARGAIVALVIAAVGVPLFVVGLRLALDRAPTQRPNTSGAAAGGVQSSAGDSARTKAEYDSVAAGRRRLAPRGPSADTSGRADLPRLR